MQARLREYGPVIRSENSRTSYLILAGQLSRNIGQEIIPERLPANTAILMSITQARHKQITKGKARPTIWFLVVSYLLSILTINT